MLPFYNPIIIAEEAATVDQLSGGRLDLGLGRGYQAHEFAGVGVPIDESRGRFNECLDIILQAWTQPAVDFQGVHYTVPPTSVYPRPAQQPHPPLWIASSVENVAIFGTPYQCVESIRTLEKELGLGYLLCNMAFGGLDHEKVKRSMTLFAQEVMPHFR